MKSPANSSPRAPLAEIEAVVLGMIVRAAAAQAPCLSNSRLADKLRLGNAARAAELVAAIEAKGWITVERGVNARVVTIIDSGKSTARPHHFTPIATEQSCEFNVCPAADDAPPREDLGERIARDQAALRSRRERWLVLEQARYHLPRRARLIDEMPA